MGLAARLLLTREWDALSLRILAEHKNNLRLSDQIPANAVYCLILAEDRRFRDHWGVDVLGLVRAAVHSIAGRGLEGASTIEQQLVRTLTGHTQRTIGRKVREMLLASRIRTILSKYEIATMYLHIAYFGWKMNGYAAACRRHRIPLSGSISMHDAAELISRLKYPEPRVASAPRIHLIRQRSEHILRTISGVRPNPQRTMLSQAIADAE
jgi:membrane peptidoglycan carboxypeptidase